MESFGFYGILTNPRVGYEALAEVMVACGVRYIQLRMKQPREVVEPVARRLRSIIRGDSLFIVNDDPSLAAAVGADGVHIGQDDIRYAEARRVMGPGKRVGLSTHNPEQTAAACGMSPLPDYIGVGPVYRTPTKAIPDPVLGLEGMAAMLAIAAVPAVAIGGIDLGNVQEVRRRGAANVCAVRCVNQSDDPEAVVRRFQQVLAGE